MELVEFCCIHFLIVLRAIYDFFSNGLGYIRSSFSWIQST